MLGPGVPYEGRGLSGQNQQLGDQAQGPARPGAGPGRRPGDRRCAAGFGDTPGHGRHATLLLPLSSARPLAAHSRARVPNRPGAPAPVPPARDGGGAVVGKKCLSLCLPSGDEDVRPRFIACFSGTNPSFPRLTSEAPLGVTNGLGTQSMSLPKALGTRGAHERQLPLSGGRWGPRPREDEAGAGAPCARLTQRPGVSRGAGQPARELPRPQSNLTPAARERGGRESHGGAH